MEWFHLSHEQVGAVIEFATRRHAAFVIVFVAACMDVRVMEWSMWKRLAKMRRIDALALLSKTVAALFLNAVFAVALRCSSYVAQYLYRTYINSRQILVMQNTSGAL